MRDTILVYPVHQLIERTLSHERTEDIRDLTLTVHHTDLAYNIQCRTVYAVLDITSAHEVLADVYRDGRTKRSFDGELIAAEDKALPSPKDIERPRYEHNDHKERTGTPDAALDDRDHDAYDSRKKAKQYAPEPSQEDRFAEVAAKLSFLHVISPLPHKD